MPKVKIQKTLSVQSEALFKIIQDILTHDKEFKALEPSLKIYDKTTHSNKITASLSGSRIQGHFIITPHGKNCAIDIELKLPLILTPFKGLVQKKIEEKLEQIS